jgi:hypothetical protein
VKNTPFKEIFTIMATNNIKPFATSSSANILKDEELATRSELQTGFPFKSKADSKLVGKLMQNATAGAYAVGEFSAKYGTTDITGSDATGFAAAFESALQAYVNEKAPSPDLSIYATKENATLTGTATLNGQNIATVNQIPDTSHFVTDTTLASYPTSETVEAEFSSYDKNIKTHIESELTGYASLTGAAFSGAITVQEPTATSNPATKGYVDSAVASVYKYKGSVANQSTLPSSNQVVGDVYNVEDTGDNFAWDGNKWDKLAGTVDLSSYLTITNASSTYLTKIDASNTYQVKGDYATNTALGAKLDTATYTTDKATFALKTEIPDTSTLATKTELNNYLPLTGGTVSGQSEFSNGLTVHNGIIVYPNIELEGIAIIKGGSHDGKTGIVIDPSSGGGDTELRYDGITMNDSDDPGYIRASNIVHKSGYRGKLSGYENITISSTAITIDQDSPDTQQVTAAVNITVSDGGSVTPRSYVKKVSIKNASATISLGSSWKWAGGSQPTVTAPSLLVLSWDNDCGIAILQTTA